jgi:hypothetical protein
MQYRFHIERDISAMKGFGTNCQKKSHICIHDEQDPSKLGICLRFGSGDCNIGIISQFSVFTRLQNRFSPDTLRKDQITLSRGHECTIA